MTILERIEGDVAVIEEGDILFRLPLSALPEGVKEGDLLVKKDGRYTVEENDTRTRRQRLFRRFARLKIEMPTEDDHEG